MKSKILGLKCLALLYFIVLSLSSQSQSFGFFDLENRSNINTEHFFKPQINIYSNKINPQAKVGVYYFALANEHWGQAYGGVIYKPVDWLLLSVGAGMEVNKNPYRFNVRIHVLKDNFRFLQIYEYGGSGFWYHIEVGYQYLNNQSLGVLTKRYYGTGPVYEYKVNTISLGLMAAPLYDFEDNNYKLLLALRYYM
jgi:hypothetical protein